MALTAHYYPQLDFDGMSVEDFAFWSENAQWMHSQTLMIQQSNAAAMLTGGAKKK